MGNRFSIAPPIQKSTQMVKSPTRSSHYSRKSRQENQLNKVARSAVNNHPDATRPEHPSPRSHRWARMRNAHQLLGSGQSSIKLASWKENAYGSGYPTIKHSGARNIHAPTSLKTFLLQERPNKTNASSPSIANNQKTSLPLSVSSTAGKDG